MQQQTKDALAVAEDTNVGNEIGDIQYQEPVEISELEATSADDLFKLSDSVVVNENAVEDMVVAQADTTVVAGSVSDYLSAEGEAKKQWGTLHLGIQQHIICMYWRQ